MVWFFLFIKYIIIMNKIIPQPINILSHLTKLTFPHTYHLRHLKYQLRYKIHNMRQNKINLQRIAYYYTHIQVISYHYMQNRPKLQLAQDDPYLEPYQGYFLKVKDLIDRRLGEFYSQNGLDQVSQSYRRYGIHREGNKYIYREWAPGARSISIFGQFNGWKRGQYQCKRGDFGLWICQIDAKIPEFSALKVEVQLQNGSYVDRIPAWINFTRQNQDHTFDGVYVQQGSYKWQHPKPNWANSGISIYECHIGMSGIQQKVHSFNHFRENILPRIKKLGYKVVQIMGIIEHPYYGSFGYHCSNFFSVSSRFGKPDQFKQLVDAAHGMGMKLIIDLVHSHAAKNVNQGINMWDGTDYQYFHGGEKGNHPLWDSRVFDYSKYEVLRFLLSNIRFWLQEYNCDGFRFDGVTSMLYHHHGVGFSFSGDYSQYFNQNLDLDALCYLSMANSLAKKIDPNVILIAEDVSGFPGLCRPSEEGGIGYGYRLAMAVPDMWIKLLKEVKDEDWLVGDIAFKLTNQRHSQPCISYAQSHDQALVGDKTISMWLFDAQIYSNMSVSSQQSMRVFRGMALHKMIRLLTFSLGSKAYLNFMGNEFGHPEWIDFPRQGNNWSFHQCRRRWDLADRTDLRFHFLYKFDQRMLELDNKYEILAAQYQYIRLQHEGDKLLIYERGTLLFVFNFNPTKSFEEYPIYCKYAPKATVIMSTDDHQTGGHCRVHHITYNLEKINQHLGKFLLYIPSRCAIVFHLQNQK